MQVTESSLEQEELDQNNAKFWNEMCGSVLARHLGLTAHDSTTLKAFDDYYFDFYPYLDKYIPWAELKDKNVLEVGLGYGTVSQRLIESGCHYHGLDIAENPVKMVKHRLSLLNKQGVVIQDSILKAPYPDNTFDYVIAIGCYHHTGNMQQAIDETYRMLKNRGTAIIMVYNFYSYRHWYKHFGKNLNVLLGEFLGKQANTSNHPEMAKMYDQNEAGDGACHTDFLTIKTLKNMTSKFNSFTASKENIAQEHILKYFKRSHLLPLGKWVGLDIYMTLIK